MKKQKNYPFYEVEPFDTIKEMLTRRAEKSGDKAAYKFDGKNKETLQKTFKEFYLDTVYLGTALTNMGFEHKKIACIGANSYQWIVVFLCVLSSNNVFIPVDKELPAKDIVNVINHSDADIVFCDGKYEKIFDEHKEELSKQLMLVSFADDPSEGYEGFDKLIEYGKKNYDKGDRSFINTKPNDVNDLKAILYTSGTTGMSKGVMLSEKNLVACVYNGLRVSTITDMGLSVLPYHHTYESVCNILVSIHHGATICINANLKHIVKNLTRYQPQYIMLVPAVAEMFYGKIQKNIKAGGKEKGFKLLVGFSNALRAIGIDKRRTLFKDIHAVFGGKMRKIVCGGAPIRPEIGKFFDDIGIDLIGGYGITECSPLVSCNRDLFNDPSTAGTVLPCTRVEIDNPNEEGIGEIKVKGDTVMLGYYKAPELTAEVMKDGWFYTGDYGKMNGNEQLIITGRKKNLIVLSNGKNVFPEELEEYISGIPEVKEVIVYCKKNADGEEKDLTAAVYLDPELPITHDELKKKINEALSSLPVYKQIREIIVRDTEFEKTTTNKIKRQNYIN